jgi:hypothetical protein
MGIHILSLAPAAETHTNKPIATIAIVESMRGVFIYTPLRNKVMSHADGVDRLKYAVSTSNRERNRPYIMIQKRLQWNMLAGL